jgi:hypothetical protein
MITLTFHTDGTIGIFATNNGVTINAMAPINQIQAVVPIATFETLRDRLISFLEATLPAPRLARNVTDEATQ